MDSSLIKPFLGLVAWHVDFALDSSHNSINLLRLLLS